MRISDWSSDVCSSDLLLHQGPQPVPADFIVPLGSHYRLDNHHDILVSNALAQAEALMRGRTRDEAAAEMQAAGLSAEQTATLAPHRMFTGNRPSTTLLLPRLDPQHLGIHRKSVVQGKSGYRRVE